MYQKFLRLVCMILVFSMLVIPIGVSANTTPTEVNGINHFGKMDGNAMTVEAENVTIHYVGEDPNANYIYVIQPNGTDPKGIRTNVGESSAPVDGAQGHMEFSFVTNNPGDYTVVAYVRTLAASAGKTMWVAKNRVDYTLVNLGGDNTQYNAVEILSFEAEADETITVSATAKNSYFNIDKFVITCVPEATPEAPQIVGGIQHYGKLVDSETTVEAEDVTINYVGADPNANYIYVIEANSVDPKCIRTTVGESTAPVDGTQGHMEFSFVTGLTGDYTVDMYVRPLTESSGKTMWVAKNRVDYALVNLGKDYTQYNAVEILSFEAEADETITVSATAKNSYFNIDKFVITCVPEATPQNPQIVDGILHFGEIDDTATTIQAENVTIHANFEVVDVPTLPSMQAIKSDVAAPVPSAGTQGDIEFSFNTGKAGDFVIWMYGSPNSTTKSISVAKNGGSYTEVRIGTIANQFQWTEMLSFTTTGDEKIKVSATARNAYFKIDRFVIAEEGFDPETIITQHVWDQDVIDTTVAENLTRFNLPEFDGLTIVPNTWQKYSIIKRAPAVYLLALMAYENPNIASTSGKTVSVRLLEQIRSILIGGHEPAARGNTNAWCEAQVMNAFALVRHTPAVWNQLTALEKQKMDFIVKCHAVSGNFTTNFHNQPHKSLSQDMDYGKNWNPNFIESDVGLMLAAYMYFDGAAAVNAHLAAFDYDTYISTCDTYGFTNIKDTFTRAGKQLMMYGGTDKGGGTINSLGVRKAYTYENQNTHEELPYDPFIIHEALSQRMYSRQIGDSNTYGYIGNDGNIYDTTTNAVRGYILDGSLSPWRNEYGICAEFLASDGGKADVAGDNGIRTSLKYVFDGLRNSITTRATIQALGYWTPGEAADSFKERMNVGVNDFLYKCEHGYSGFMKGEPQVIEDGEEEFIIHGYTYIFEVWTNYLSDDAEMIEIID